MKKNLNIVLVNTDRVFNAKGGVEKIFCQMANALSRRGHTVTAVCFEKSEGKPGFPIDDRVKFVNAWPYAVPITLSSFCRRLRCLALNARTRKVKRSKLCFESFGVKIKTAIGSYRPDIIICFQLESAGAVKKAFGGEVPSITMFHFNPKVIPLLKLMPDEVSGFGRIQVLMPEYVDVVKNMAPGANVFCIPNPVPQFSNTANRYEKTIIHVGRVVRGKRQHLIVKAFSLLKEAFPDWKVELWGEFDIDAKYTEEIRDIIRENGIGDRVALCGITDNIPEKLSQASIFAFPSDNEGFPLALTEAMAMGLPVIGCKEAFSVSRLIRNGENGFLVDSSPEDLADALSKLMASEELRIRLGDSAMEDMKEYAPEKIWDQWEDLLVSLKK